MRRLLPLMLLLVAATVAFADPTDCPDEQRRAGYPQELSRFARPSDTGRYVGNLIGGGNPFRRQAAPPTECDGTWGWDFAGGCFRRNVLLGWWHGKTQGGPGKYATDGPKILHPLEHE